MDAVYWCETPEKIHLRWVMPHPEEQLLGTLARLHTEGYSSLGKGTRLVGSFHAHGLTVPVWDLSRGVGAQNVEKPAAEFAERLATTLGAKASTPWRGAKEVSEVALVETQEVPLTREALLPPLLD